MSLIARLRLEARDYLRQLSRFNRNVRLVLLATVLSSLALGIFSVDFNLYILSIGIKPDTLGKILSAGPIAQIIAAIPIGFFAERIGFRKAFLVIYGLTGISWLAQVSTPDLPLIASAAFLGGLAMAGNFVVRLPFYSANVEGAERTHVFSFDSMLNGAIYALGALLAGYLPNLFQALHADLTASYRVTLYISGVIMLLGSLPIYLIREQRSREVKRISLKPYLWGMDRFMVKGFTIEFFLGLSMGLIVPFINIIFIFHLQTTREFYSAVEAFVFIPTLVLTALGPVFASRLGSTRTMMISRFLMAAFTLALGVVILPALGASTYWAYRALFTMSQAVWFAYAMAMAAPKAKAALSAWLNITFEAGMAVAAPITGLMLAQANYVLPFFLASGSAAVAGVLTYFFLAARSAAPVEETVTE